MSKRHVNHTRISIQRDSNVERVVRITRHARHGSSYLLRMPTGFAVFLIGNDPILTSIRVI